MPFEPTDAQLRAHELLSSKATDIMLYGGSRSGKTTELVYFTITRAMKEPNSRHAIFRYHLTDIHTSIYLDTFPKVLNMISPDIRPRLRESKDKSALYTTFPNGSEIWFAGLDTPDRAEKVLGREFSTAYFNEVSQIPFASVLKAKTRLAQKNGLKKRSVYDCNPSGTGHWSYGIFVEKVNPHDGKALSSPENYASLIMNPADNLKHIDPEFLKLLDQYPDDERNRFLYGIWNSGIDGAVFNREMTDADRSGRICAIGYDKMYPVFTGWDIGVSDKTAIWFAQFIGGKINFIDYYENQFYGISHYAEILKAKGYDYGVHFFPHDVKNRSFSTGKTRIETAEDMGLKVERIPNTALSDGLNACRSVFPLCSFDREKCIDGIECLRNYRYVMNETAGMYGREPFHDWTSHGADAFRSLCMGYEARLGKRNELPIKKTGYEFSAMLERKINRARELKY